MSVGCKIKVIVTFIQELILRSKNVVVSRRVNTRLQRLPCHTLTVDHLENLPGCAQQNILNLLSTQRNPTVLAKLLRGRNTYISSLHRCKKIHPCWKSSNLVTGCGWLGRRIVSMAAIKKDHTLSSHWRGMMDDYLKVWQVLHWWGSSHYPSSSAPPLSVFFFLS